MAEKKKWVGLPPEDLRKFAKHVGFDVSDPELYWEDSVKTLLFGWPGFASHVLTKSECKISFPNYSWKEIHEKYPEAQAIIIPIWYDRRIWNVRITDELKYTRAWNSVPFANALKGYSNHIGTIWYRITEKKAYMFDGLVDEGYAVSTGEFSRFNSSLRSKMKVFFGSSWPTLEVARFDIPIYRHDFCGGCVLRIVEYAAQGKTPKDATSVSEKEWNSSFRRIKLMLGYY